VIASEEFGKGFGIAEISFQAGFSKKFDEWDNELMMALLSDHKLKQGWFVGKLFGVLSAKSALRKHQPIQVDKNNASYVGVRRGNIKSCVRSRRHLREVSHVYLSEVTHLIS
jgi:hypothetical protein